MEEQGLRILRPRRRGPPPDHNYSTHMSASNSLQLSHASTLYVTSSMMSEASTANHSTLSSTSTAFESATTGMKQQTDAADAEYVWPLQTLDEIIAWLKDDPASPSEYDDFTALGSGARVQKHRNLAITSVQQSATKFDSAKFYTPSEMGDGVQPEGGEQLRWQSEMSLRQRNLVLHKLRTGSQQQCSSNTLSGIHDSRTTAVEYTPFPVKCQLIEDQVFQSAHNQEDYYYQLASAIMEGRPRSFLPGGLGSTNERTKVKKKCDTNLLRSLLQGDPVTTPTKTPDILNNESNTSLSQENNVEEPEAHIDTPVRKRRKKKRRRNEYDFGHRKKYPKQEREKVGCNKNDGPGGVCRISSHNVQQSSSDSLFTIPVSSGTILEECADICDLRTGEGNSPESPATRVESDPVSEAGMQTPRECCPFCVKHKRESEERSLRRKNRQWKQGDRYSTRLLIKHYKFPFMELPLECKMHVFSFLDAKTKGVAVRVCSNWRNLLYDPETWTKVNFDFLESNSLAIPVSKRSKQQRDTLANSVYETYQSRVKHFIDFLSENVHPRVESLAFNFDIGNFMDNWYIQIKKFLQHADLKKLLRVECNWQVTEAKPGSLERYCCILNKTRVLFKLHHYRAHIFHKMLKHLTEESPHVTSVKMPFDWSERAVFLLCRWDMIEELWLLQYLNLRPVSQLCIDTLVSSLRHLTIFRMDICIPVFSHRLLFTLSHNALVHLDLSNCKGFFLKRFNLPSLKTLQLCREPWHGPLVEGDIRVLPCLYPLFCQGTPLLEAINKHKLHGYWQQFIYQELEAVLAAVCPCAKHWTKESAA